MIHVIIAVYNRLELTLKCLDSLKIQNNFKDLNIIIVDDGSTDGTNEFLRENYQNITILNGNGNLFSAGCFELGIEYVLKICKTKDWILLVSNDSELDKNAIVELVKFSEKKSRQILTGALTINALDRSTIIRSGAIIKSWFFNFTEHAFDGLSINDKQNLQSTEVDFLPGRCLLHPVEMFKIVGNYNSKKFKHYGNDEEFAVRSKKLGYSSWLCVSSLTYVRPNDEIIRKGFNFRYLIHFFFSERSNSNIIDKFKLAIYVVPYYAKISYFLIGLLKSIFIFLKIILKKN